MAMPTGSCWKGCGKVGGAEGSRPRIRSGAAWDRGEGMRKLAVPCAEGRFWRFSRSLRREYFYKEETRQKKACNPVMARPKIRAWTSWVPS